MAAFKYKARNAEGRVLEGQVDAENEDAARAQLRGKKYTIMELAKVGRARRGPKVKTKEIVYFSRQLATMQAAALPLVNALSILADGTQQKGFKAILTQIRDEISSGVTMSEALAKHPQAFAPLYVNMIRAGEQGGSLSDILDRLSTHLEKAEKLKQEISSAMMYPIAIATVAMGVVFFLKVKVIPSFKEVFASFGKELPLPTRILLEISDFLQHKFYVIIGAVGAFVGTIVVMRRTEAGSRTLDQLMLKMPLLGPLLLKYSVAMFSRTLGTLMKSGVQILESMEIVARIAGNKIIEGALLKARSSMREGEGIAGPLRATGVFPAMVIQMVNAGEESGKLDEMLIRIADFYDSEVETAVGGLLKLMEPLMMVFLGGAVGGIVLGMFLPMFEMSTVAG